MHDVALTIAGSDPSGGAGIQADLKTFHQHGVYGASAITLLTVQNTERVSRVEVMPPELVREQIEAVLEDLAPRALKTGALGGAGVVREVVEVLRRHAARGAIPRIVDPVMISKHGAPLLDADAAAALREELLPLATLITPNAPEASALSGVDVRDLASARAAARAIVERGATAALVKGGHLDGELAIDVLVIGESVHEIAGPRIATRHTHGTGCTYSAAITARLALGEPLLDAVHGAKRWLTEALRRAPGLGHGIGPVDHLAPLPDRVARPDHVGS